MAFRARKRVQAIVAPNIIPLIDAAARKARMCDAKWRMAWLLFWLSPAGSWGVGREELPAGSLSQIILRSAFHK
jgi:hypothetical protein